MYATTLQLPRGSTRMVSVECQGERNTPLGRPKEALCSDFVGLKSTNQHVAGKSKHGAKNQETCHLVLS